MKERARILFKELLKLVSELEAGKRSDPHRIQSHSVARAVWCYR